MSGGREDSSRRRTQHRCREGRDARSWEGIQVAVSIQNQNQAVPHRLCLGYQVHLEHCVQVLGSWHMDMESPRQEPGVHQVFESLKENTACGLQSKTLLQWLRTRIANADFGTMSTWRSAKGPSPFRLAERRLCIFTANHTRRSTVVCGTTLYCSLSLCSTVGTSGEGRLL